MRAVLVACSLTLLIGCGSTSERIGPAAHAPKPAGSHVPVFASKESVTRPFLVIGTVSYFNAGIYQQLSMASSFEPLKEKARELGADAVIISKHTRIYSGLFTRGVVTEGDAIVYTK
jgi:hypothetical protein